MYKKLVAAVVGAFALAAGAAPASAGLSNESIVVEPNPVDAGDTFNVTYVNCVPGDTIAFEFQGETKTDLCESLDTLEQPQGIRALPGGNGTPSGVAQQMFTAPATAGEYPGIGYVVDEGGARDLQAPAQPQGFRGGGGLVEQPAGCSPPPGSQCAAFTVTVVQQATTTTAAPTTTTGQTPATTSGGVSGGGVTNTLPATGASDSDNTATIAIVLLVAGFGLIVATRWRSASDNR